MASPPPTMLSATAMAAPVGDKSGSTTVRAAVDGLSGAIGQGR
ncbi:hypothetical protein ABQE62_05645 [Mycolicibacterium fortuitum]